MDKVTMDITEEVGLHDHCPPGLDHQSARDSLNGLLGAALGRAFVSPYAAVERMGKVLANYGITLPRVYFLRGTAGSHVFEINQFGMVSGMNDKGEVVTKRPRFSLVFSYDMNESGMYTAKAKLVDHNSESSLFNEKNEQ